MLIGVLISRFRRLPMLHRASDNCFLMGCQRLLFFLSLLRPSRTTGKRYEEQLIASSGGRRGSVQRYLRTDR
jgi:hypothetical protein